MNDQQLVSLATSYTTKLLRSRFGKGPESISVYVTGKCVIFHLKNCISPVEKFLLNQEEEQAFRYTRELIMKSMLPELKNFLNEDLNLTVDELYYDWGIHNASGIIVGLDTAHFEEPIDYNGKQEAHDQILDVISIVQKRSSYIDSWWVNSKILVIFRKGITILLEKELFKLGYEQQLRVAKRKLEKGLLKKNTNLGQLFDKKLADIYIDWDFDLDHSTFVYTFK